MDKYSAAVPNLVPVPRFPQGMSSSRVLSSFPPRHASYQCSVPPSQASSRPPTSHHAPSHFLENERFPRTEFPGFPPMNYQYPQGLPSLNQPPPGFHTVTPNQPPHRFQSMNQPLPNQLPSGFHSIHPQANQPPPYFQPPPQFSSQSENTQRLRPGFYPPSNIPSQFPELNCPPPGFHPLTQPSTNYNLHSQLPQVSSNRNLDQKGQESSVALEPKECLVSSSLDLDWARKWAEGRHFGSQHRLSHAVPKTLSITLSQFQMLLAEYISLNEKLKSLSLSEIARLPLNGGSDRFQKDGKPKNVTDCEEGFGENAIEPSCSDSSIEAADIQARMKEIRSVINNEDVLQTIENRLARANKKRMRLKRKRKERYEEEQELDVKRERQEIEIAQWKNDMCLKEMDVKKEKEMKKAADEILSEVRRKLTEGRRSIKLLGHLRKLRDVRKEKALQKKCRIPKESDEIFEERVGGLMQTMQQQISMYEAEEQALEVMLDMEQEENLVIERIARRKKERERLQQYETQLHTFLFGEDDVPGPNDPLYPYRQFYDVAQHSLAAFVRIRQDWDMFAVQNQSPGGSSVPLGWVVPVEPSNEIWASALASAEENTS